jgi:hypothetical protein
VRRRRRPNLNINNDNAVSDVELMVRYYNAICYKDISLIVVWNPMHSERDVLAMEVTMAYHKGVK